MILHVGLVWHPVGLASPTMWRPRGSPRRNQCMRHVLCPGLSCGSPWRRAGGMPHPARQAPAAAISVPGHPEACPPGEAWCGRTMLRLVM